MKKAITVLLAMMMVLSLAACGGSSAGNTSPAPGTSDAADKTQNAPSPDSGAAAFEPMELVFTTIYDENSSTGAYNKYFMDYVTDATGGAVTWKVYWSGTMASAREELDMVSSGSADVASLNVLPYANQLVLAQWPRYTCTGLGGVAEYGSYLLFENGETAALIQSNFEENGVHTVGFGNLGSEAYFSVRPVQNVEDMKGMLFGTGTAGALETSYGMNVVFTIGPDCYDSLSRAVIDVAGISIINAHDYCLEEVAPYWVCYGRSGLNGYYSINLDKWNSFSPELKAVFEEAGRALVEYAVADCEKVEGEILAAAAAKGVTVVTVKDNAAYGEADFMINAENALVTAQTNNKLDAMKTIIKAGADKLGYDVTDLLAKY